MGRARIEVSYSRLANLLGLPEGSEVYGVRGAVESFGQGYCELFVKHCDLPEMEEGLTPPLAHLVVAGDEDAVFVKWGLGE